MRITPLASIFQHIRDDIGEGGISGCACGYLECDSHLDLEQAPERSDTRGYETIFTRTGLIRDVVVVVTAVTMHASGGEGFAASH